MRRALRILFIFVIVSTGSAKEGLLCSGWNTDSASYLSLKDPFIGFTETTQMNGDVYAGWYIVEARFASLLPFKAFFYEDLYIDGLEIGEHFTTERSEWAETPFMNYPNMLAAFKDISEHAPVCSVDFATN